ncbi:MAG: ABC transporter permease [Gemmatimonadaceae bacterium]
MRTLSFLLRKEYRQIFRDRLMLAQILLMPIIQLVILANAATFAVTRAKLYVVDRDHTVTSRGLVTRLVASGRFTVVGASPSMALADQAMLHRTAGAIVNVPAEFERDVVRTRTGHVQLILDAKDGAAAGVTASYARSIITDYGAELSAALHPTVQTVSATPEPIPSPGQPRIEIRARNWFNPELSYHDYMIPGILVELVTIAGTLLTAINITREKEIGTLDQLNVTPVTRAQFIAGKLIPIWSITLVEFAVGMAIAMIFFHVPVHGSLALLALIAAVYLVAALGIGLWVSTVADTQQQAMFVVFFLLLIYLLLSGLFTPLTSMPEWAQWLAHLNPVMYFVAIMRAVMMKGAGVRDVVVPFAILAVYGAVVLTLAVRQYAKRTG